MCAAAAMRDQMKNGDGKTRVLGHGNDLEHQ